MLPVLVPEVVSVGGSEEKAGNGAAIAMVSISGLDYPIGDKWLLCSWAHRVCAVDRWFGSMSAY